ncbi:MAG TPA: hypothetical protein VGR51_07410 [Thermoplasmata archaeon]|jgi:hypothetical protein|nr:hypothetical protein [Thermoplasmata archaeon]
MCEGYWDKRLQRWVPLEELEDRELEELMVAEVRLPPPAPETKRRPAAQLR